MSQRHPRPAEVREPRPLAASRADEPTGGLAAAMPFGIAVLGPDGLVDAVNDAARDAIESGYHGLRYADGVLEADTPCAVESWHRAVREALAGTPRLVRLGDALPVGLSRWIDSRGGAAAICTFGPDPGYLRSLAVAYGAMFRLTDGETAVLAGLIAGLAPKRIAQARGSTESTVRSQIKSVLAKTGCHGLRELVGEVMRQPPLLARHDPFARGSTPPARGGSHLTVVADASVGLRHVD